MQLTDEQIKVFSLMGKESAKKQFTGKTKQEIHDIMQKVSLARVKHKRTTPKAK